MAFKIVTTTPRAGYAFEHERESLDALGAEIIVVPVESAAQFGAAVADADALMMGTGMNATPELIAGLRQCKVIINGGVGVDRIDIDAATKATIPVVNVPDVWLNEVADHAMMLLLATIRKLVYANGITACGGWGEVYEKLRPVPRIQGKTLGLVAFGNIARNVAKRAQAFGMNVIAFDPYVEADVMAGLGVEKRSLEDLLKQSDFVSAHAPHNRETHHLLSDAQFALMKPSAIFVNTGRGRVVDEPALIKALQERKIAAAALDVTEQEPADKVNPLRAMDNVLLTPHTAYYSDEAYVESRRRVGQEIAAILTGKRPRNCVNPSVLEKLPLK
jgi:D-3-phosphoglycerate dehydrogenase